MSDLVAMIAVAKGTIVGASGIIHVDPGNARENGRYSRPIVSEADAQKLEQRKLAVRDEGQGLDWSDATIHRGGYPSVLTVSDAASAPLSQEDQSRLGDPDALLQAMTAQLVDGNGAGVALSEVVVAAGTSLRPDPVASGAAAVPSATAATDSVVVASTGEIESGLGDNDPDAPPVASGAAAVPSATATPAGSTTPAAGAPPRRGRRGTG